MATAVVVGLSAGKRLLSSSFNYSDLTGKLSYGSEQQIAFNKSCVIIVAKKTSNYKASFHSGRHSDSSIKAIKEHTDGAATPPTWRQGLEEETLDPETSVEALLALQKSRLDKQLELSFKDSAITDLSRSANTQKELHVISSGKSARIRRMNTKGRTQSKNASVKQSEAQKLPRATVSRELLQNRSVGYMRWVTSNALLTDAQVVNLSQKIKVGLSLEEHRSRLKERLGCEPSDQQLAMSLKMTLAELRSKLMEYTLAREKLTMSNVRLVMSIAHRYENMGADMADLIQGGLIGLLRGIEKFDSSKGFKISTYVYWWIRQGISRALAANSRIVRLPYHLRGRLSLIHNAKNKLLAKGITPSLDRIAECLNMSQKKIMNAMEADRSVFSLDREAFPSLSGRPGETWHSYIADNNLENNPWHGVRELALKLEVNNLIDKTLEEREKYIVRLYYGLDDECLSWEEIGKRISLSRERVRQVGLVAVEKLKQAARKRRMEALLVER